MSEYDMTTFGDNELVWDDPNSPVSFGNVADAQEALVRASTIVAFGKPSRDAAAFQFKLGGEPAAPINAEYSSGGVFSLVGVYENRSLWEPMEEGAGAEQEDKRPTCRQIGHNDYGKPGVGRWNMEEGFESQYPIPDNIEEDGAMSCSECPYSKYGSALKGAGQACRQRYTLLLIPLLDDGNIKTLKAEIAARLREEGKPVPDSLKYREGDERTKVFRPDQRFTLSSGSHKIPENPGLFALSVNASTGGSFVKKLISIAADSGTMGGSRRPSWQVPVRIKPMLKMKGQIALAFAEVESVPGGTVPSAFGPIVAGYARFADALVRELKGQEG